MESQPSQPGTGPRTTCVTHAHTSLSLCHEKSCSSYTPRLFCRDRDITGTARRPCCTALQAFRDPWWVRPFLPNITRPSGYKIHRDSTIQHRAELHELSIGVSKNLASGFGSSVAGSMAFCRRMHRTVKVNGTGRTKHRFPDNGFPSNGNEQRRQQRRTQQRTQRKSHSAGRRITFVYIPA